MNIQRAVKKLRKELKNDKEYYYAWQANIAMAFVDALDSGYSSREKIHKKANQAAKYFLDLLIGDLK